MSKRDCPKFDVIINVAKKRSLGINALSKEVIHRLNFLLPLELIRRTSHELTLVLNTSTYIQNFQGIKGKVTEDYSASKQSLSEALEIDGVKGSYRVLDLYLFTLYGPGDHATHLIPLLLSALKSQTTLALSEGLQLMNLLYIEDAVASIVKAITHTQFGYTPNYLWKTEYLSLRELVSTIELVAGMKLKIEWGARSYSGHEMFQPWSIPFQQFPEIITRTTLLDGLKSLLE